ncbi:MAG: ribosome small subunit-dependent GTPase A [Chthoniobacteraceae bacterium]
MTIEDLGWTAAFEAEFTPDHREGWKPARLIRDNKITYGALLAHGEELEVTMSGKIYHDAATDAELPAVGDWVALEPGGELGETMIRARLTRQTCLSRKMSGRSTEEQVIAANVNVVVVVTDAGPDFSQRRMERYFAITGKSRAKAVVLVNKADLFPDAKNQAAADAIRALNPDADVHITSAEKGTSLKILRQYLKRGVSMTLVGSSGVGKSSIVNHLLGDDYQWTDEVNETTGKGRHSTTARELFVLPGGGILIDNPGIREIHMWTDETTLRERFADIEELAGQCKFHDCKHGTDAGCAIRAAMAAGKLSKERFEGFQKLEEELEKLRLSRKKREMTGNRHIRRQQQKKQRKYAERRERDHDHEPPRRRD